VPLQAVPATVLVLGGRSEIGMAVAERLVRGEARTVVLAARRSADLDEQDQSLRAAGASSVERVEFDADDIAAHPALLEGIAQRFGPIGVIVVAFGVLGDQARAEFDPAHAVAVAHTNYLAHVSVLTVLAAQLRRQGSGTLVVFSSVAGVRVRRANYVYGSTKAGLDGFASGLADALAGTGARLLLVRPGFVIGRMTAGMAPAPFPSTVDQVADAVVTGLQESRRVVWAPPVLRLVFAVARLVPQRVWRRLPR